MVLINPGLVCSDMFAFFMERISFVGSACLLGHPSLLVLESREFQEKRGSFVKQVGQFGDEPF